MTISFLFQISTDVLDVLNNFKVVSQKEYPKLKYHNNIYILIAIVKIVTLLIAKMFCYFYRSRRLKSWDKSEQELLLLGSIKRLLEIVKNCQDMCNIVYTIFAVEYSPNSNANRIT